MNAPRSAHATGQLIAKRRFEVAEQAISTFAAASDALSAIRDRVGSGAEQDAVDVPDYVAEPAERAAHRKYGVYFNRAFANREAFAGLRPARVLCDLHVSERAGDALDVPFRIRQRALAAAYMLITEDPRLHHDEDDTASRARADLVKKLEDDLLENRGTGNKPMPTDRLSQELDVARAQLEVECCPFLREQTLFEFLWGGKARARSVRGGRA